MNRALAAAGVLVTLTLAGCSSPAATTDTPTTAPPAADSRTDVQWADYDPTLQAAIDGQQAAADCVALQSSFDTADSNNTATTSRTGHNNAQLMSYIDETLRLAGCY